MEKDPLIIGAGGAGLMAANIAVQNGLHPIIIEKNEKAGKKLYITGKGRCNFTNVSDFDTFISNINTNPKFMYSALRAFSNTDTVEWFERHGLKTKVERGNRAFPESDRSSDVIKALLSALKGRADIHYDKEVSDILISDGKVRGVKCGKETYEAENVIVATGGLSYPSTGSTGDGYKFASKAGLKVNECSPCLVPFNIAKDECVALQGLALKNIAIKIEKDGKELYSDFGELLFTHFGVSGPVILSASAAVPYKEFKKHPTLHIDLKPALDMKTLDDRVLRDFKENENRNFSNSLNKLLPSKLIPFIVKKSGISPDKKVNSVTKAERLELVRILKDIDLGIDSLRGFDEAVITRGGVDVKELNPKTFESKKIEGLYFAGEIVDIDAMTGGYNLQLAFSSAFAAATAVAAKHNKGE